MKLILIILQIFVGIIYGQKSSTPVDTSYLYFDYKIIPDSVFVNGTKIDFIKLKKFAVDTGNYKVQAFKKCYYNFEKDLKVRLHRIYPVYFILKHLTTTDYQSYSLLNVSNYTILSSSVLTSFFYKNGTKYLLPISLFNTIEYFIWHLNQNSKYDRCSRIFSKNFSGKKKTELSFGIDINVTGEYSFFITERFNKYIDSINPGRVIRNLKKEITVNPNDYLHSSYSANIGIAYEIKSNLLISGSINLYPNTKVLIKYYENSSTDYDYEKPTKTDENTSMFFVFNSALNYYFYSSPVHEVGLVLGGHISNSLEGKTNYTIQNVPDYLYASDDDLQTSLKYSYKIIGGYFGIISKNHINDSFAIKTQYSIGFPQSILINGKKD